MRPSTCGQVLAAAGSAHGTFVWRYWDYGTVNAKTEAAHLDASKSVSGKRLACQHLLLSHAHALLTWLQFRRSFWFKVIGDR